MVRKAEKRDIGAIIRLLHQVNMVHYEKRPDLFKPYTTKYDEQELEALLGDDSKPIFVYDDGEVLGHADDICVEETARGRHIGQSLYEYVRDYARSIGCYNITLNVWEGNDSALSFYRSMGMQVQKTGMETIL